MVNISKSSPVDQKPTQPDLPVVKMVLIAVIVFVSLMVIACVVFATVVCRKLKHSGQTKEQQRPNSVANRVYATEGFHNMQIDDEEYTLISDMEIEHQSSEPYKPPVPDRGSNTSKDKDTKEIEIVTLAEYSLPSDNVRVGCKISQISDYCMTTYDDPIRLKLKEEHKKKGDSVRIENCLPDGNDPRPNKRDRKTNSKNLDRNSWNSQVSDRNSRNSQMSSLYPNSATADIGIDTQSTAALSEVKYAKNRHETIDLENTTHTKQNEDTYEDSVTKMDQKQGKEILENLGIHETLSGENDIKENPGDDSDYEDPNILEGNFPTKCSSPFEEHVCLHCLKPEHLTKLGIKIISDDMYEKSKIIRRSISDPSARVYYNKVDIGSGEEEEIKLQDDQKHERDRVKNEEDTLTDLNVVRRKKTTATARRCSVCHTVYDKLGDTQQNAWANCTDNVYDKFGNFKHFKHRGQVSGKRMNST
ncbi:uncharacterized protein LOC128559866 [Mercenaria mercenaria]|uniref:uncharacterized protein LOC128559866 n=1 Tax=Mercenaria mercenaria TaxID=6596 RepID=UPI00234F9DFD|nr:uncharacterized protein LOC128559866 [Mercenaria mercenaria]